MESGFRGVHTVIERGGGRGCVDGGMVMVLQFSRLGEECGGIDDVGVTGLRGVRGIDGGGSGNVCGIGFVGLTFGGRLWRYWCCWC